MGTVKHKLFGMAKIIRRDGDRITIKYDKDGKEVELKFPDSFITKPCLFILDTELQREVDEAVAAKKEAERIAREAREAQRALEQATTKVSANGTKRSGKTFVAVKRTGDIEKDFEHFLKANNYSEETKNGTKSTVYFYVNAVKVVIEDEGLDWAALMQEISDVVRIYDIGGAKEEVGYRGNNTVINALRRFQDFVNNSMP